MVNVVRAVMKFWHDYLDRKPFLALAWLRLTAFEKLGELSLEFHEEVIDLASDSATLKEI